jgi:hypothetical protein
MNKWDEWPKSSFRDPYCRCSSEVVHQRCLIHRGTPEQYQVILVARRLLGPNPGKLPCAVCHDAVRRHSTGNYFHISGYHNHPAVPTEWWVPHLFLPADPPQT